jgi:hypothetical protein
MVSYRVSAALRPAAYYTNTRSVLELERPWTGCSGLVRRCSQGIGRCYGVAFCGGVSAGLKSRWEGSLTIGMM